MHVLMSAMPFGGHQPPMRGIAAELVPATVRGQESSASGGISTGGTGPRPAAETDRTISSQAASSPSSTSSPTVKVISKIVRS